MVILIAGLKMRKVDKGGRLVPSWNARETENDSDIFMAVEHK